LKIYGLTICYNCCCKTIKSNEAEKGEKKREAGFVIIFNFLFLQPQNGEVPARREIVAGGAQLVRASDSYPSVDGPEFKFLMLMLINNMAR
jgi:hypothetical protein